MTKQELKNGMIVETREGFKYLYLNEILRGDEAYLYLSNYNDDLTIKNRDFPEFDVVKVFKNKLYSLKYVFRDEFLEPIWVRPETPKLSEREIEVLKALDTLGFTHIARDRSSIIYAYYSKPIKAFNIWFYNGPVNPDETQSLKLKTALFAFVGWKDEEPVSIQELLSDFEKENKDLINTINEKWQQKLNDKSTIVNSNLNSITNLHNEQYNNLYKDFTKI